MHVDSDLIQRVVDNLVSNFLRHTRRDGLIRLAASAEYGTLHVEVRDNGEGIPHELQSHIFDKFVRAESAANSSHSGVGLGLAFCRLAVEAHGGRIWVESATGMGSRFRFTLPATPVYEAALSAVPIAAVQV